MKNAVGSIVWFLAAVTVVAQAPMPVIQNGQVHARPATSPEAAVRTAPPSPDATWVAWREPMVDGGRRACSSWTEGDVTVRGMLLEPRAGDDGRPQLTPSQGPAQLEAGTGVVMLLRVIDGHVERLRTISDDCPIDANGRTVEWLTGVTPAESLRYLSTFAQPGSLTNDARRLAQSAASAIAMHRDVGADLILDRLVTADIEGDRDNAWRLLAGYRGRHGYDMLTRAIAAERNASTRQHLVSALRQSSDAGAVTALLTLAKSDPSEHVRAEAVADYAALSGVSGLPQVIEIATKDVSQEVQRRAVSGVARLPQPSSVPALLTLARTSSLPAVRKEAIGALSRTDDPRATAYLEEIVGK